LLFCWPSSRVNICRGIATFKTCAFHDFHLATGLIIDAFGELRDQLASVSENLESECFICGIGKDYFDSVPHGFDTHVQKEHNLANYLWVLRFVECTSKCFTNFMCTRYHSQVLLDAFDQQTGHGVHGSRDLCMEHVPATLLGLLPSRRLLPQTIRSGIGWRREREERIKTLPRFLSPFLPPFWMINEHDLCIIYHPALVFLFLEESREIVGSSSHHASLRCWSSFSNNAVSWYFYFLFIHFRGSCVREGWWIFGWVLFWRVLLCSPYLNFTLTNI
jgi:hypothetical protein